MSLGVCVCVCFRVQLCMSVCVRVCVCVCTHFCWVVWGVYGLNLGSASTCLMVAPPPRPCLSCLLLPTYHQLASTSTPTTSTSSTTSTTPTSSPTQSLSWLLLPTHHQLPSLNLSFNAFAFFENCGWRKKSLKLKFMIKSISAIAVKQETWLSPEFPIHLCCCLTEEVAQSPRFQKLFQLRKGIARCLIWFLLVVYLIHFLT